MKKRFQIIFIIAVAMLGVLFSYLAVQQLGMWKQKDFKVDVREEKEPYEEKSKDTVQETDDAIENSESVKRQSKHKIDRYRFINQYEEILASEMADEQNLKDSDWKAFYREIIDAVYQYHQEIPIRNNADGMAWISTALLNNIFVRLAVDDFDVSDQGDALHIKYRYSSKREHDEKIAEAEKRIEDLINEAEDAGYNELEKCLTVYTYWATNLSYDYDAEGIPSMEDVLFFNKGICQNYATIISYTCSQMNMEVYQITGDAGGPHAWNLVKIDGRYYHLDATFESEGDTEGHGLMYFGLSDKDIRKKDNRTMEPVYEGAKLKAASQKLKKLRKAYSYTLDNHILTLLDVDGEIIEKINIQNLSI